jgi:maleylpyruvate isomerase
VTEDGDERQRHITRVGEAHAELHEHLAALTGRPGADPTLASLLPGWTRGHVLTHIARNADSFVRVLDAARRGEVVTQYERGGESRNADIEAGATRDWESLVDDVRSSATRLDEVFATQDRWDLSMTNVQGESVPHADLPFRRLREVVVHHADLGDDGFTPANWPAD